MEVNTWAPLKEHAYFHPIDVRTRRRGQARTLLYLDVRKQPEIRVHTMSKSQTSATRTARKVKPAIDAVDRFLRKLQAGTRPSADGSAFAFWRAQGGPDSFERVVLTQEEEQIFFETLDKIEECCSANQEFSRNALVDHLKDAIFKVLDVTGRDEERAFDGRLRREMTALRHFLESDIVAWVVYLPVRGIYDESLPRRIGRVDFLPTTDTGLAERLVPIEDVGDDRDEHQAVRLAAARSARKSIHDAFDGHIAASIVVDAVDEDAAYDLGEEEIRRTIDVINFYADIWRPRNLRAFAYVSSDERESSERWMVYRQDASWIGGAGLTVLDQFDNVWLPPEESDDGKTCGLNRVHQILSKSARTEVDQRLLSALRWTGRATAERRDDQAFLFFAIALEALLTGRTVQGDISYRIAMRSARLCAGEDIHSRRSCRDRVKRLYDLRSRIVHQGFMDVTSGDVESFRQVVKAAIIAVLTQEHFWSLESNKSFEDWFEDQLLE